jgi:Cation/multidrug efflux pump
MRLPLLHRPADLRAVVSIVFVILGAVSIGRLPVAQYPEIAPPVVRVSGQYPGASADVVAAPWLLR